jgi:hypothetical protein
MNHTLCREFVQHKDRDGSLKVGSAPNDIAQWLKGLRLPNGLLRLMQLRGERV